MVIARQFESHFNWLTMGNEKKLVLTSSQSDSESCHLYRKHNPFVIVAAAATGNTKSTTFRPHFQKPTINAG